MTRGGFYERKTGSPAGLGMVIAMHAGALGALALIKGPEIIQRTGPIDLIHIPAPPPETDPEPPRRRDDPRPNQPPALDRFDPIVQTPADDLTGTRDLPGIPPVNDGAGTAFAAVTPELPPPLRVEAQWDPVHAIHQQPPYPPSELRADRGGVVRVEVSIGADGRVKAVRRLSATSDAFWRATERHALARWRFRPATLDGRPVEGRKLVTVTFRLEG